MTGTILRLLILVAIIMTSVLVIVEADDLNDQTPPTAKKDGGTDKMKANLVALYEAIHHFALPDTDITREVDQRFILQMPGKVLNPADYYPGNEYERYLQNPHKALKEVHIPPMVMEKMFQLSDIVPGSNSLTGGETGYSLARTYEAILGIMDVIDFNELTTAGENVYEESLNKLLEPIPDPENSSRKIPLLQLYSQFQDAYHDEQRKMEETIKEKEKELDAIQYQLWFQRHFHILNAKVEGAYTRWLLYGRKHLVESYIAHFDITSSGETLEDARVKMRSSGFSSLDRSQIAYPVSFTPSNWYKYLESKETPLTRDQILAKLESVNTRITLLTAMLETTNKELDESDGDMNKVKEERGNLETSLKDKTKELEHSRKNCWFSFISGSCDLATKEGEVSEALSKATAANLKVSTLEFQFGAESQMTKQIRVVLDRLTSESKQLQEQLDKSEPSSSSSLVDDVGTTEPLTTQEIQDNWAMFDFSSTKSSKESKSSSLRTSTSIKGGYGFFGSASISASVGKQSFSEHVQSADLKIKAKFLKVKINRPWFRSDLFKNREFTLQRQQRQSTLVSPGPLLEKSFNELKQDQYLLYQYPTAFLLAKDVTMEFSGLDAQTKQSALSTSFGVSARGGWGPFSFGGSSSTSTSSSEMRASSTANGLRIKLPGAQLIGYYCDVVPKFPNPLI